MSARLHPGGGGRALVALVSVIVTAALLVGCQPEPSPGASESGTPTPSVSPLESMPATPSPVETQLPDAAFQLPSSCDELYSPAMRAALESANPPLNDPGVTMTASQNVEALELLASGIPTIRCSWGQPSETGLATNVSTVDAAQSQSLQETLAASGFACQPLAGGTVCSAEQTVITQDDAQVTIGEAHYFRGDGWVATAMIDFSPDGYTEDIVATLWR